MAENELGHDALCGITPEIDIAMRMRLFRFALRAHERIKSADKDGIEAILDDAVPDLYEIAHGRAKTTKTDDVLPESGVWRLI